MVSEEVVVSFLVVVGILRFFRAVIGGGGGGCCECVDDDVEGVAAERDDDDEDEEEEEEPVATCCCSCSSDVDVEAAAAAAEAAAAAAAEAEAAALLLLLLCSSFALVCCSFWSSTSAGVRFALVLVRVVAAAGADAGGSSSTRYPIFLYFLCPSFALTSSRCDWYVYVSSSVVFVSSCSFARSDSDTAVVVLPRKADGVAALLSSPRAHACTASSPVATYEDALCVATLSRLCVCFAAAAFERPGLHERDPEEVFDEVLRDVVCDPADDVPPELLESDAPEPCEE